MGVSGLTKPLNRLRKPMTSVQQGVAGIETSRNGSTRGRLPGGGTEARCIVGDVVRVPGLLFDRVAAVATDSRKEGEALDEAPPSLPSGDVKLDLQRLPDVSAIGGNLHHHPGLKAEGHSQKLDHPEEEKNKQSFYKNIQEGLCFPSNYFRLEQLTK